MVPAFVGVTNQSGQWSGIAVQKFTRSQDFCSKPFLLCRKCVGNCWETFFYGYVTLLHVLLTKMQGPDNTLPDHVLGCVCSEQPRGMKKCLPPGQKAGLLTACYGMMGPPNSTFLSWNATTACGGIHLSPTHRPCEIWDTRETANKHAQCLCGYPLSNQVLCL